MLLYVVLWFLLGVAASVLVSSYMYEQLIISLPRVAVSIGGALVGAMIMLLAAPAAWGWAALTALMGSAVALTVVWLYEHDELRQL